MIDVASDGATQSRISHVQYTSDVAWLFGNTTERCMIPFSEEEARPVDDSVTFAHPLFYEMLRPNRHAIWHVEMFAESLCMDLALFVSDNATEVNRIQEQPLIEMIQRGADQEIISAWSAQIAKQRKDGLSTQLSGVAFEDACSQRTGIRQNINQNTDYSAYSDVRVNGFNET
jgi:hypothetical protein